MILRGSKARVGLLLYVLAGKVYFAHPQFPSAVSVTGDKTKQGELVMAGAPHKGGLL